MSNPVFIVGNDRQKFVVIRFFESKAADFELENKTYEIASKKGYAPQSLETDYETYRVEECFAGRPFKHSELMDTQIKKECVNLICDFNFDQDMIAIKKESMPKSLEYIESKENGWYWKALDEVIHPLINAGIKDPIIDEIHNLFYQDQKAFKHEYMDLLPL